MDNNWIKKLKVGDKVIVQSSFLGDNREEIGTVEKMNKKTVKINGILYQHNGVERAEWSRRIISPFTEEGEKRVLLAEERRGLISFLERTNFGTMSIEKLRKIYKIVKDEDHE